MRPVLVMLLMLGALIPFPAADATDPRPDPGPERTDLKEHLDRLFGLDPLEPQPANGFCKPGAGCLPLYVDEEGDTMTGPLRMLDDIEIDDGSLLFPIPSQQAGEGPLAVELGSFIRYDHAQLNMPIDMSGGLNLRDDVLVNGSVLVVGAGNTFEVTDGATFIFDNISVDEIIADSPDEITFSVNNSTVFRLVPTTGTPNIIGGHGGNDIAHPTDAVVGGFIGGGGNATRSNVVLADYSLIGGGHGNTAGDPTVVIPGFITIAGGESNTASRAHTFIGGGADNAAKNVGAVVVGGLANTADGYRSFIGSGWQNRAGYGVSSVVGGQQNAAEDWLSSVVSGSENTATGWRAVVLGGYQNLAGGNASTVLNGYFNEANGFFSIAAGRQAKADHDGATVLTDSFAADFASTAADEFSVRAGGGFRFVSDVDPTGVPEVVWRMDPRNNFVGGHAVNQVDTTCGCVSTHGAVIAGGGAPGDENLATGPMAVIGGGMGNEAGGTSKSFATIGGGLRNRATEFYTTVGGGESNLASGSRATVTGGWTNTASGSFSVAGGRLNAAQGFASTVAGGDDNAATDDHATVAGGADNMASGQGATVGGGGQNTASGTHATVPGGDANTASGTSSLAAGQRANAAHAGSFVWSDSNAFDFASTAADEFSARATGGVRFVSGIDGTGAPTAGVTLASGSGSWSSLSDRAAKQNVVAVDPDAVLDALLAMPLYEWSYIAEGGDVRHMGPMAQDFGAAFGLGADDTRISTVDADGVALAGIQGLYRELEERDRRIQELEARLVALEQAILEDGGP